MDDETTTIADAIRAGVRIDLRCAWGTRLGMKSIRECHYRGEIDLRMMAARYRPTCSLASLRDQLHCPWCGTWRVSLIVLRPVSISRPASPPAKRHPSHRDRQHLPVATIAELRKNCPWFWVCCARGLTVCDRRVPMALVPLIIRWGPNASSDLLRQRMRCTACGALGAVLQHPSSDGMNGIAPFPAAEPSAIPRTANPPARSGRQT